MMRSPISRFVLTVLIVFIPYSLIYSVGLVDYNRDQSYNLLLNSTLKTFVQQNTRFIENSTTTTETNSANRHQNTVPLFMPWPQPRQFISGDAIITAERFQYKFVNGIGCTTLTKAFERYNQLMFFEDVASLSHKNVSQMRVQVVNVKVVNVAEDYPQLDTNESYELIISSDADTPVLIKAETIYGVLHALESLSQLVVFDYDNDEYRIYSVPIHIVDKPRYPHRGLLVDTGRHYLPIANLERVIDSMAYAKLNVLHWHIVDSQV